MIFHRRLMLLIVFLVFSNRAVLAAEWTRFRGPNGTGVAENADVPVTWTEDDYKWRNNG